MDILRFRPVPLTIISFPNPIGVVSPLLPSAVSVPHIRPVHGISLARNR